MKRNAVRGFTIVELLIVVVVIGILAAITLVSFNGISQRAKTVQYAAALDNLEKQLQIGMINGTISVVSGYQTCLGDVSDFPADNIFAAGECYAMKDASGQTVNAVSTNTSEYPALVASNPGMRLGDLPMAVMKNGGYKLYGRGVIASFSRFTPEAGLLIMMQWVSPDQSSCGRGEGLYASVLKPVNDALNGTITVAEAEIALGLDPGSLTIELLQLMRDTYSDGGDLCTLTIQ